MSSGNKKSLIHTIIVSLLVVGCLLALRLISSNAKVYLNNVHTSGLQFSPLPGDAPLFNETALSDSIALTGFSVAAEALVHDKSNFSLIRQDQLHVKDLHADANNMVLMSIEGRMLGIAIRGCMPDSTSCVGRIGTGTRVLFENGTVRRSLSPDEPNMLVNCIAPSCSLLFKLRDSPTDRMIQEHPVSRISFQRPGTRIKGEDSGADSLLEKGELVVSATDLLGNGYALRTVSISRGDTLLIPPEAVMNANLDIRDGIMIVGGEITGVSSLLYAPRGAEVRNLMPSMLELLIREPWHVTLWGIIAATVPVGVALVRRRRYLNKLA